MGGIRISENVQPNSKILNYPLASKMDFIFIPKAKFEISPLPTFSSYPHSLPSESIESFTETPVQPHIMDC